MPLRLRWMALTDVRWCRDRTLSRALRLNKIRKGSRECQFSNLIQSNSADGRGENGNSGSKRWGDFHFFSFCLWSVITEADWGTGGGVISQRVQQFGPSWDYIIFPNCKWSLSIHQTMNQQRDGGVGATKQQAASTGVWASEASQYGEETWWEWSSVCLRILSKKFHSQKNKWQHQEEQAGRLSENCFCSFVTNREIKAQVWLCRDSDPLSRQLHITVLRWLASGHFMLCLSSSSSCTAGFQDSGTHKLYSQNVTVLLLSTDLHVKPCLRNDRIFKRKSNPECFVSFFELRHKLKRSAVQDNYAAFIRKSKRHSSSSPSSVAATACWAPLSRDALMKCWLR